MRNSCLMKSKFGSCFLVAQAVCSFTVCPTSTYCYAYSNNTAQCLCASGYVSMGWTNSYTQACALNETNVVNIALPIVFGVLAIQILMLLGFWNRRRVKQQERPQYVFYAGDETMNRDIRLLRIRFM